MVLNFIKRLNQRTINMISTILNILIITTIASIAMSLVFGVIGKLATLSFMTSLAGYSFLVFLIAAGVLIAIVITLLICFFIDAIKRGGLKKLIKEHIKTFTLSFFIMMVVLFIKSKKLEWIESLLYSLLITLSLFFKTEVSIFIREIPHEHSANDSSNESDSK